MDTITEISEIPDKELLARHARGDDSAFGELVRRHRDRMWAVALRTMGDADEAADALQDAFVSAFRAAGRFRGDAAVTTWLHRIVVNACLDRMRRRAVRPAVPMGDDATLDVVARGQTTPGSTDPTDTTDAALDVAAALATLPVEQRAALVLVDMMGYPVDEVARILDIAVGTVKSRCARGRARLLPHLGHLRNQGAAGHVQGREGGSGRP